MTWLEGIFIAAALVVAAAQLGIVIHGRRRRRRMRQSWRQREREIRQVRAAGLVGEMAHGRAVYAAKTGADPKTLAIGRWDARELAYWLAPVLSPPCSARQALKIARDGVNVGGADVKVDGRIGRMPRALWWHP